VPTRPVEFSPRAERQIAQIEAYYLKEAGASIADDAVAAILGAASRLGTLPVIYRTSSRVGLREYVLGHFPYILIYRAQTRKIQIVAIIHHRQKR
jgi:plasmid stabilization system protein ParE